MSFPKNLKQNTLAEAHLTLLFYDKMSSSWRTEIGLSIKVETMTTGLTAFIVHIQKIKSFNEAIVLAGNSFYTQPKEYPLGNTGRLPPEIYSDGQW